MIFTPSLYDLSLSEPNWHHRYLVLILEVLGRLDAPSVTIRTFCMSASPLQRFFYTNPTVPCLFVNCGIAFTGTCVLPYIAIRAPFVLDLPMHRRLDTSSILSRRYSSLAPRPYGGKA